MDEILHLRDRGRMIPLQRPTNLMVSHGFKVVRNGFHNHALSWRPRCTVLRTEAASELPGGGGAARLRCSAGPGKMIDRESSPVSVELGAWGKTQGNSSRG